MDKLRTLYETIPDPTVDSDAWSAHWALIRQELTQLMIRFANEVATHIANGNLGAAQAARDILQDLTARLGEAIPIPDDKAYEQYEVFTKQYGYEL